MERSHENRIVEKGRILFFRRRDSEVLRSTMGIVG